MKSFFHSKINFVYFIYMFSPKKGWETPTEQVPIAGFPNFICSKQRVILFYYIDIYDKWVFRKKNRWRTKEKQRMMSAISSLVRIWKISHSYPGCSFVWKIRVVCFSVKHSYLCTVINKYITLLYWLRRNTRISTVTKIWYPVKIPFLSFTIWRLFSITFIMIISVWPENKLFSLSCYFIGVSIISRIIHVRTWIRIFSCSSRYFASCAHSWDIDLNTRR